MSSCAWVIYICVDLGTKENAATNRRLGAITANSEQEAAERAKKLAAQVGIPYFGITIYRSNGEDHFGILKRANEQKNAKSWVSVPKKGRRVQPKPQSEDTELQVTEDPEEIPVGSAEDVETVELALSGKLTVDD